MYKNCFGAACVEPGQGGVTDVWYGGGGVSYGRHAYDEADPSFS